jgi:transcriptional regulator with XRE-family HTH domain
MARHGADVGPGSGRAHAPADSPPRRPQGFEPEQIGPLLARLRLARGLSQLQTAERLCDTSGMPTVTRHEVSRWEREERVPGSFWRRWLAVVLEAPLEQLEAAAAATRRRLQEQGPGREAHARLWCQPDAADLIAALDCAGIHDARGLAHAWLAGPLDTSHSDRGPAMAGLGAMPRSRS